VIVGPLDGEPEAIVLGLLWVTDEPQTLETSTKARHSATKPACIAAINGNRWRAFTGGGGKPNMC
jgi:hypothetical protein